MLEAGISVDASGWRQTAGMAIQVGAVSDLAGHRRASSMLSIGQKVKVASRWRSCSAFCECRAGVSQKAGLQRPPRLPAQRRARPEFCPLAEPRTAQRRIQNAAAMRIAASARVCLCAVRTSTGPLVAPAIRRPRLTAGATRKPCPGRCQGPGSETASQSLQHAT